MNSKPIDVPGPPTGPAPTVFRRIWHRVRSRILGGLMLVLPILITLWVIHYCKLSPSDHHAGGWVASSNVHRLAGG